MMVRIVIHGGRGDSPFPMGSDAHTPKLEPGNRQSPHLLVRAATAEAPPGTPTVAAHRGATVQR